MYPRLLRTFLAVARSRNVTRAAEEIHLAQSSVSDQIQSLETELGTDLFARSKLGLELTRAGEALMPYAEEILRLSDEARAAVKANMGKTAGTVTIGALETIASVKLPRWLSAFQDDHPDINLKLKVAGSGDLLRKLEDGEIRQGRARRTPGQANDIRGAVDPYRVSRAAIPIEDRRFSRACLHELRGDRSRMRLSTPVRQSVCRGRHCGTEACRRSRQHQHDRAPRGGRGGHGPGAAPCGRRRA